MNPYGGHIAISGTTFDNFNSCGSLIRFKDGFEEKTFENDGYYDLTDNVEDDLQNYMRRSSNY